MEVIDESGILRTLMACLAVGKQWGNAIEITCIIKFGLLDAYVTKITLKWEQYIGM